MKYSRNDFQPFLDTIGHTIKEKTLDTAVVGISDASGTILTEAYGMLKNGRRVEEDSIYLIFSVTKPILCFAVMQLWEQGKLNPLEPVNKYIPEFQPIGGENIKIWHLITHTSGLDQAGFDKVRSDPCLSGKKLWDMLLDLSFNACIHYPVGTYKEYNNLGFALLSEIIKRVSGLEHDEYLKKNVFSPLGMTDTSFTKYLEEPNRIVAIKDFDWVRYCENKYPFGSLQSSIGDLNKLLKVLLNNGKLDKEDGRLISQLTLKAMTTPQTAGIPPFKSGDFEGEEISMPWYVPINRRSLICKTIYGHNGLGNNMFWVYPEQGVGFVILSNTIPNIDVDFIHNSFTACLT